MGEQSGGVPMNPADIGYEEGDRVVRRTPWDELEYGKVVTFGIDTVDGRQVVETVTVLTEDDEAFGVYHPADWRKAP